MNRNRRHQWNQSDFSEPDVLGAAAKGRGDPALSDAALGLVEDAGLK